MIKVIGTVAAATLVAAFFANGLAKVALAGRDGRSAAAASKPEDVRPGQVSLRADSDGHFRVEARVGGRIVPMLVDTGATVVALSFEDGEKLGLIRRGDYMDVRMSTANGVAGAKRVTLQDVRIGSVKVDDVAAVVMSPGAMDGSLLGMSFLGRLRKVETGRGRMTFER